jgi:glycosyltransferase involved in cell wall biosynthesis
VKVNYISACLDSSGYAEAARNNIGALAEAGVDVHVNPVSFENFKSDLGMLGKKVQALVRRDSNAPIQIVHTTPNIFHKFYRGDKYNIAYTTWETTNLPKDWVENINLMDEVWVPCKHNVETFRNSGVTKPILVVPHTFNIPMMESEKLDMALQNVDKDDFVFYSIFQWTARKNPVDMLKAYLTEFTQGDKVCLILKTYLINPNDQNEKEALRKQVIEVKEKLYLDQYPKIVLVTSLLSKPQVFQLHRTGNCYLSFHRNEGFGIPIAEAMMVGNPVIATDYGGTKDFVSESNAYPIPYQETPVYGMPWNTYKGNQVWADINIMEARKAMRRAYTNREEARQKGLAGRSLISESYSWPAIAALMKSRLETIYQEKRYV